MSNIVVYTLENVVGCIAYMVQSDLITSEPIQYEYY